MSLDAERKKATFDVTKLITTLHGSQENYDRRLKFESLLSDNPLFDKSNDMNLPREEYIQLCIKRSIATYKILKSNRDMLAAHSPVHGEGGFTLGPAITATGFTDHFSLFVNTIMFQGSKDQVREWLLKSVHLQMIGTYAQTELGHGSNIRGLETTATYDAATDEFIIHSPSITAAKWWPGALGLLCTHAIMYARLLIGDKDHGFHAFMVQIRDENHKPLPGVEVGDLGPKMGYQAYDSGYLLVKNLRIPRFNMLAKFQSVEKGGEYKKAPPQLQKIAYFTMLKTRVGITLMSAYALAKTVVIATRFSATRRQGFVENKAGLAKGENAILDYTNQQAKLFPLLAASYAIVFGAKALFTIYDGFAAQMQKAKDGALDASALPVLHCLSAGLKAFGTNISVLGMEECRKCCGGQGYSFSSGIGYHYLTNLPAVTYEGDIGPMSLQTARFLVGMLARVYKRQSVPKEAAFLGKRNGPVPATKADFRNSEKLVSVWENATRNAVQRAGVFLMAESKKTKQKDAAWNEAHPLLYNCAQIFSLYYITREFALGVSKIEDANTRKALHRLMCLFAITRLKEFSADHNLPPKVMAVADEAVLELLEEIRPDAIALTDGWGITDFAMNSCIGNYNNDDMYERLLDSARKSSLNDPEFVSAFHRDILSKFLNKEYLAQKTQKL